jgi:hypothetical protein
MTMGGKHGKLTEAEAEKIASATHFTPQEVR